MGSEICGERNSSAEAEQHAQAVHGNVNNWNAELVDEGRRQKVEQREQPPHTDEERVVDDGVCAICCAVDVVGHERCDEDGADELATVNKALQIIVEEMLTCQARRPIESARDTILTVVCEVGCCVKDVMSDVRC